MILKNKNILVTGATGSFGQEFIKEALKQKPKRLICFSRDELKQDQMRKNGFTDTSEDKDSPIRYFLGDIRDKQRLKTALHGIDIIIHAAALKQVPAIEYNPYEAVKTNIIGSQNIIEAAIETGVKKVIALSTDKAVNPINAYGASKLMAEKLFINGNVYASGTKTRFSVVRYGNVIASRGSVIPLFLEQYKKNGFVTITDKEMTRFFITLNNAVKFVIRAIADSYGGEIFVPKMKSAYIKDIAELIANDNIQVTGIRPGEKMHEVLTCLSENVINQDDRYIITPAFHWFDRDNHKGKKTNLTYSSEINYFLTENELKTIIEQYNTGCNCGRKC